MGGYSFQLEYSIFSPKSKVHFMQPILKRVGCFFIDRREVKSRTGKEVAVPEKAGDTETYFNKLKPYLKHMVTGNEVPLDVFYQKEPALAPNMLLRRIPGCEETVERLVQGLRLLAEERRKEPLQIIEIGTRDTAITRQFLNALEDVSAAYTYADSSKYFLQEAEKELAGYERVEFEI